MRGWRDNIAGKMLDLHAADPGSFPGALEPQPQQRRVGTQGEVLRCREASGAVRMGKGEDEGWLSACRFGEGRERVHALLSRPWA